MKSWLSIFFLLCFFIQGQAFGIDNLHFNGFIADEAELLTKDAENDLNMTLWDLQKKSGADIAVVTLKSLNGKTVESTALDIGRSYKIGSKEKNNGVVFLTALDDREMRIEIGLGLENKIKMSDLNSIRDNEILPYFRENDYQNGILRGTYKLADLVAEAEGVTIQHQGTCPSTATNSAKTSSRERAPWWIYLMILGIGLLAFAITNESRTNKNQEKKENIVERIKKSIEE